MKKPIKPTKPQKYSTEFNGTYLIDVVGKNGISLELIRCAIKEELKYKGIPATNIEKVKLTSIDVFYNDDDVERYDIGFSLEETIENKKYESELTEYKRKLKGYKEDLKNYEIEIILKEIKELQAAIIKLQQKIDKGNKKLLPIKYSTWVKHSGNPRNLSFEEWILSPYSSS